MAAQNIYDSAAFFEEYSKLDRSVHGLAGAAEWPSLQEMLPQPLQGLRVVDLGCGFGWFCRWARDHGASQVLGLDISQNMLARARDLDDAATASTHMHTTTTKGGGNNGAAEIITYETADLEHLILPTTTYDLVYSSLALHYVVNLSALIKQAYETLVPGGHFVFSVEHPICTAPSAGDPAWGTDPHCGRSFWPLNGYHDEGPRVSNWLADGVVKQHRTVETYITLLLSVGFTIGRVREWAPSKAQVVEHPEWARERERPFFLMLEARR